MDFSKDVEDVYEGEVWDPFYFYSSLWDSCTNAFKGVPLSISQFDWVTVCDSSL